VVQKKGESLQEFILKVDHKSIIIFFKKELRDSSLIHKLTMKNPRTSEKMLEIANKHALTEEATFVARDQKKDKELGHLDQSTTSKSHDKWRKADRSVANVEWPRCNKEYWPRPGEFKGFLDWICIFHP
jgi:hypothetical protein